ncbi:MAG: class I SAM-dependent methyltransferase [Methyloprofundus sp.]|nr:class I SAM-dependent methyltransferase [Methyloprofundus sp.]MDT8424647.1 class I SAM-dependent methyltransferase [Methyloprofundus sp.]
MLSTRFTQHSLVTEAHKTIQSTLSAKSITLDATMGNGHDTLFLARHSAKVYAFDIQQAALDSTYQQLQKHHLADKVVLTHESHEQLRQHIPVDEQMDVIIFNLGYLPRGDTTIITKTQSTLSALNQALDILSPSGIISIVCYPGHAGGQEEMSAVTDWYHQLNSHQFAITIIHSMQETAQAPRLFVIKAAQNFTNPEKP